MPHLFSRYPCTHRCKIPPVVDEEWEMSSPIGDLGELQLTVLRVLWKHPNATVHEVLAALPPDRSPAYTTVLTVLRSMEKRGLVAHEQVEGTRMFRYRALYSESETLGGILRDVQLRLFEGSPLRLVTYLLETEPFTPHDINQLKRVLKTKERAISEQTAFLDDLT